MDISPIEISGRRMLKNSKDKKMKKTKSKGKSRIKMKKNQMYSKEK